MDRRHRLGQETSNQIEIVFSDALAAEGLLALVEARADGRVEPTVDDDSRPVLLAVSDNGPQMMSGSNRDMALCAIAQHVGRPGTPTDQAWIESFFGHLKIENRICRPSRTRRCCGPSWTAFGRSTTGVRLHAGIG